jgi:hypothetical protein
MSLIHPLINLGREFVISPWQKPIERNLNNHVKISLEILTHMAQRIMALPMAVALFTGLLILGAYSKARDFIVLPWEKPLELSSNNQIQLNINNLNHLVKRIIGLPTVVCLIAGMFIPTLSLQLIMLNIYFALNGTEKILSSYSYGI